MIIANRARRPWTILAALAALVSAPSWGCGTVKTTGTARTGTEQLLLTNAWDTALQKVDFRPLTGVPVFLDTSNVTAVDQGWVVSSLRQAMLMQGVLLRAKAEQAQWIVEARVGAYGTNEDSWLLGIPQVTVPPTLTGMPTGTIPKIPIAERNRQQGVAKLALFAYDRASGQLVWNSGTMQATANVKDVTIGGVGPIRSDPNGTEFMGARVPSAKDMAPSKSRRKRGRATAPTVEPFEPPPMAAPPSAANLETFAP